MGAYSKQSTVNNYIDKIFVKESGGNVQIGEGYIKNSSGFSLIYKNIKTFTITYNVVGCEINSEYHPVQITEGTQEIIQVWALDGYTLDGVTPTVTGASSEWDGEFLYISNPTDNVVVSITAKELPTIYTVSFSSDYAFSIDGSQTGTSYSTTYEYNNSDPTANNLYYGISMDGGIDSVTISGTYGNYTLGGNYGDTYRSLEIYNVDGDISITITGVV